MEVGGNKWLFLYTYYYAVLYVNIQRLMMQGIYTHLHKFFSRKLYRYVYLKETKKEHPKL